MAWIQFRANRTRRALCGLAAWVVVLSHAAAAQAAMADLLRPAVPPDIRFVRFASPKQAAAASPLGNQGKFRVPRRAGQAGRPSSQPC